MNKAEQIVKFIRAKNPRRKELVKFIVVNLNKKLTSKEFDELKVGDSDLAYYSTNICKWKQNGNVEVKNKRYRMTKYYNGHLYKVTHKVEIEISEARARHWKAMAMNVNEHNEILVKKNEILTETIKEIREIII